MSTGPTRDDVLTAIAVHDDERASERVAALIDALPPLEVTDGTLDVTGVIQPIFEVLAATVAYCAEQTGRDMAAVVFDLREYIAAVNADTP